MNSSAVSSRPSIPRRTALAIATIVAILAFAGGYLWRPGAESDVSEAWNAADVEASTGWWVRKFPVKDLPNYPIERIELVAIDSSGKETPVLSYGADQGHQIQFAHLKNGMIPIGICWNQSKFDCRIMGNRGSTPDCFPGAFQFHTNSTIVNGDLLLAEVNEEQEPSKTARLVVRFRKTAPL